MPIFHPMQIHRQQLLTGAAAARDTAIIIDVFRAYTCSSFLLNAGVERVILEEDPERALALKHEHGWLALGEVNGVMVEGFDLGNSPSDIVAAGEKLLRGRTVVQRTSAGVRGAVAAAENCRHVFVGAFTTAAALAAVVRKLNPAQLHIVAMGWNALEPMPEDERCADYIQSLLEPGRPYDHVAALHDILTHESARKFLRGDKPHFPPTDVTWCLMRDLFPWAIRVERTALGLELERVYP